MSATKGKKAKKEESEEDPEVDDEKAEKEEVKEEGNSDQVELFVGNLSFNTSEDSLRAEFAKYGEITNIKMPYN